MAKTTVYKYKVAVNPTKQKKRTWGEGQRVRKVGRAVTFDASGSEKETRERFRGGAKNHGANGSLRGGEDHTGSRLRGSGTRAAGQTERELRRDRRRDPAATFFLLFCVCALAIRFRK